MNVITYVNPSELFARLAADLPDDVRDHVFVGPGAHPCPGAARDAHRHGGLASALALRAPDVLPNAMESFGQSGRRRPSRPAERRTEIRRGVALLQRWAAGWARGRTRWASCRGRANAGGRHRASRSGRSTRRLTRRQADAPPADGHVGATVRRAATVAGTRRVERSRMAVEQTRDVVATRALARRSQCDRRRSHP